MRFSKIFLLLLTLTTSGIARAAAEDKISYSWKPTQCTAQKDPTTHNAKSCTCDPIGNFKVAYDMASGNCVIKEPAASTSRCEASSKTIKIVPDSTLFVKEIEVTPTSVSYIDVKKRKVEGSFDWQANKWNFFYFEDGTRKNLNINQSLNPASVYDENLDNAHTQILLFKKPNPRIVFQKRPNRLQEKPEETLDFRIVVNSIQGTGQNIELRYLDYPVPLARAHVGPNGTPGHATGVFDWNQDEPVGAIRVRCDGEVATPHEADSSNTGAR